MQIIHIEAIPIALPLAKPVMMGGRRYERSESLLVNVVCDGGLEGWGEAAPYTLQGDALASLLDDVKTSIAPYLLGEDLADRGQLLARVGERARCSPRAFAAVEIALADAWCRAKGIRLADALGGARRLAVAQKWLIGGPSVEDDILEVERRRAEGLFLFMLKVGSKALADDVRLVRALRNKFGDSIRLCADANGAWSRAEASAYLEQTADLGLLYLEQPLPRGALQEAASLAEKTSTPLSLDEGVNGAADIIAAWRAGATRGAIIKPSKYGGLARAIEAGTLCAALGLHVGLATPMAESSIGTAAALHVAAALPQVDWDIGPSSDYLAEDLVERPLQHCKGVLRLGSEPGLGVAVSRRQVERFRLDR